MRARATLCVLATALLFVGGVAAQECDATDTLCHRAKAAAASAPPKMIPDDAPDLSSPPRPTKTAEDDPSPPEPSSTRVASCAVCEAALTEHAAAVDDLSAELTSMKASVADAEARVLAATKRAEEEASVASAASTEEATTRASEKIAALERRILEERDAHATELSALREQHAVAAAAAEEARAEAEAAAKAEEEAEASSRAEGEEDPWFPPWVRRRAAHATEHVVGAAGFAKQNARALLAYVGVLEQADEVFAFIATKAAPHVETGKSLAIAAWGKLRELFEHVVETFAKARRNLGFLWEHVQKSGRARREYEARKGGWDVDEGPPRKSRTTAEYWSRQGARAGELGEEALEWSRAAWKRLRGWWTGASASASEKAAFVRDNVRRRATPKIVRFKAAIAKLSLPLAGAVATRWPTLPAWFLRRAGPLPEKYSLDPAELAKPMAEVFFWILVAMGASSIVYWTVFRTTPGDSLPDDAEFEIVHLPADDGTFVGRVVGGGVDVLVTLPDVQTAEQCEIMVSLNEVRVKALDGYHDVKIEIPSEARGRWNADEGGKWRKSATFDVRKGVLKIRLRPPTPAAEANGAVNAAGIEAGVAAMKIKGGGGRDGPAAAGKPPLSPPPPFSPLVPSDKTPGVKSPTPPAAEKTSEVLPKPKSPTKAKKTRAAKAAAAKAGGGN